MELSKVGTGISVACAVHCAALPLLAGTSCCTHGAGGALPGGVWLEAGMIGAAALVGYTTLGAAFLRHRRPLPLMLLTLGLAAIGAAHFVAPLAEHAPAAAVVGIGGALLLLVAQRMERGCVHCASAGSGGPDGDARRADGDARRA